MSTLPYEQNNTVETSTISTPRNVTFSQEGSDSLIRIKWSVYGGVKSLAASVFVLFMTLSLLGSHLQKPLASGFFSTENLAPLFFSGVFFVLGVYWLVLGIYQIFNSTVIRVNQDTVSTEHQPLPWRKRSFPTREIEQLFITSHIVGDIIGSSESSTKQGDRRYNYAVNVLIGGQKTILIQQLESVTQAQFIEDQLERHLGIENMTVRGEW